VALIRETNLDIAASKPYSLSAILEGVKCMKRSRNCTD